MWKLDATRVTERVFVDWDDFVKLTFEVWRKDWKAIVTTDIDCYWDEDKAFDVFTDWLRHWIVCTAFAILKDCWCDSKDIAKVMKWWLEEMAEIAREQMEEQEEEKDTSVLKKFMMKFLSND